MNTEGLYNTWMTRAHAGAKAGEESMWSSPRLVPTAAAHEAMHAMVGQLSEKARGRLQDIVESDPAYAKAKEKEPRAGLGGTSRCRGWSAAA